MNGQIIGSTFLLTVLMMVGLFFFIKASVKNRTKQITLVAADSVEVLLSKLQTYFEERAYKLISVEPEKGQVTFEGFVQPSWFLAIFLSFLAAFGFFCLSLIINFLYPEQGFVAWLLPILAPLAGLFYWRKAGRLEKVLLAIQSEKEKLLTVTAHRDELIQLQEQLPVQVVD